MLGKCPNCGNKFEIQAEWLQKVSECPYCHHQIIIEADEPQFSQQNTLQLASLGKRFLALILDVLILSFANFILTLVLSSIITIIVKSMPEGIQNIMSILLSQVILSLLSCILGMIYEAYFLTQYGATPGKMVFNIKVQHNGQNLSIGRAIGRYWARSLSGCICCIGYIMAFFNPECKALHDIICDTTVVQN